MGFIMGLVVGSALSSGGSTAIPNIPQGIPFRCLAAIEQSDSEYRNCRWASMYDELYKTQTCGARSMEDPKSVCHIESHIKWELAALKELKAANEAKAKAK